MGQSKDVTYGWIWPKDPKRGNPSHWPRRWRLKDVLTGKGPDIYYGAIKSSKAHLDPSATPAEKLAATAPKKTNWSRWDAPERNQYDMPWARRPADVRYDFRTRKYMVPNEGTWKDVYYCSNPSHDVPRAYRDQGDRTYPSEFWHDSLFGPHWDE